MFLFHGRRGLRYTKPVPPHTVILILFAVSGLVVGSFSNVLLIRTAKGKPLDGRSKCPHCKKVIAWYDLIPVLSFVLLGGRCRRCKKPIGLRYPLTELATMILFIAAYLLHSNNLPLAIMTVIVFWGILLVTVFDAYEMMIPDAFTAIIAIGALGTMWLEQQFLSPLLGACVGAAWFGFQWLISRGNIVGSGDIFLGFSLGLWLGLSKTIPMLAIAYMTGACVGVILIAMDRATRKSRLAFGPFLAIGAFAAYLGVGDAYLQLIGL